MSVYLRAEFRSTRPSTAREKPTEKSRVGESSASCVDAGRGEGSERHGHGRRQSQEQGWGGGQSSETWRPASRLKVYILNNLYVVT